MVGPAGTIGGRAGAITSAADNLQIRLFGRGAHGSMPQASIDPVVMAAATVMRLQTIVSRELAAAEAAVVTIGSLQAGTRENVSPEEAGGLRKPRSRRMRRRSYQGKPFAVSPSANIPLRASSAPMNC